jgi:integrase
MVKALQRQDGETLANSTKAKLRNLMSVLFNQAIRYEWLEQGKNPITLVRQSASRQLTPEVLEAHEIQSLLAQLDSPFQIMVLLDITTGLRRSELFALKWSDVDFWNLTIDINRSIFQGVIGNCKTEASRRPVPLSLDLAADLWLWKERAAYSKPDDWIFASPWEKGSKPYWPNTLLRKIIRPAAVRAGIKKRIGWHTLRRSIFHGVVGLCKNETSRQPVPLSLNVAAICGCGKKVRIIRHLRLGVRNSAQKTQTTAKAGRCTFEDHSACSHACGYKKENRLAYIAAYLFIDSDFEWRKCESGSGINAPRKQSFHLGCLHAS